jgi:hypothetical protein
MFHWFRNTEHILICYKNKTASEKQQQQNMDMSRHYYKLCCICAHDDRHQRY